MCRERRENINYKAAAYMYRQAVAFEFEIPQRNNMELAKTMRGMLIHNNRDEKLGAVVYSIAKYARTRMCAVLTFMMIDRHIAINLRIA